ncbi:MAG: type II toxin-antitoxin system HicB family antitoxin [Burkholderiales bacterium]|jgi:antitoxin HicB|nr:type II toxin-antitoxin system HicB family antitoxin [Burkholderiales bacterium]
MKYPVIIEKDQHHGFAAFFPDIPEALTCGDTYEEALEMASDALLVAFEFYFDDFRIIPPPSRVKKGQAFVDVPPSVSAKIFLLNEMIQQKVTNAELARRIGTKQQEITRIVNLRHATKIDTIDSALRALGRHLDLSLA